MNGYYAMMKLLKKYRAELLKSQGKPASHQWWIKRGNKLREKKIQLNKQGKKFTKFCEDEKNNKGKLSFGADSRDIIS